MRKRLSDKGRKKERKRESYHEKNNLIPYLQSSGRRPSGRVEEVGLPITAVDVVLEVWEWADGAVDFLGKSLATLLFVPFVGKVVCTKLLFDGTLSLLNWPLDTANLFASKPIWWVNSTILSLFNSALLRGRVLEALIASAANFFLSISASSRSADLINSSHLIWNKTKKNAYQ